jgi:hypothetical protein
MHNLRNHNFRNCAQQPCQQELVLASPSNILRIGRGGSNRKNNFRGRLSVRPIKETKQIMSFCMRKNKKLSKKVIIMIQFDRQLIRKRSGMNRKRGRRGCHETRELED